MIMANKISWLFILTVFFVFSSCRNDVFPEQEAYSNSSKFQLTSKRISLSESKHKVKLLPELEKTKLGFGTNAGKAVQYGNGVYINTDDVIYIENGAYHTYTFKINRQNAPADAPIENLVLSPLPDGSYREFLVSYQFTEQEKQNILMGIPADTKGKTIITELVQGTYNGNGQLARSVCGYVEETIWVSCYTGDHNQSNWQSWHECNWAANGGTPPMVYTVFTYKCIEEEDDTIDPSDGGSGGGGSGGSGGSGTTTPPCETPAIPTIPQTGFTDPNGCPIGVPTLPNLGGNPKETDPCAKTKDLLNLADVSNKLDSLKNKSLNKGEIGFKTKKDGSVTGYISGGKHEVDMGVKTGYQGGYHNHTPTGIPMHSPPDIDNNLLAFAKAQPTGEHKNAYFGMIVKKLCTSCVSGYKTYHYIIRFNGEYSDALTSFSQLDLDKLNTEYSIKESKLADPTGSYGNTYIDSLTGNLTNEGLEVLFFDTVRKMGLTNKIILQRIEDNGTVNNVTLNPDGLHTTITPCI